MNMQLQAHRNSDELETAFSLINSQLRQVREIIDSRLGGCNESVGRVLEHFNSHSGKMLRPGLVLLAGLCCGKITDTHIRVAAIVEMIHNATLLHDDVIDEGQKRRGLPTVNRLWGNESAVLLGDFLLSKVFMMCADLEPRVAGIIAATTGRICEGELRQVVQQQNWQLSESEYIEIITEKSASLFSSCCHLGGLLSGAGETQAQSLACFGLNIGIGFQITDDLLDIIGDESKTGKTLGSDVSKHKLTLATIHLLKTLDVERKKVAKSKLVSGRESKKELAEMLKSWGSLEYARRQAREFVTKGLNALTELKESDAKSALIGTAEFVADRVI